MGLFNNDNEIDLLRKAGIEAEKNKEYTFEEKKNICIQVSEFIMSHSTKNGDIGRLQDEYSEILRKVSIK